MSRTGISSAGMRIMRLLIGHPPQKMNDIIKAIGVTRTAVTEQVNELINAGYVLQSMERIGGRGRPRFLYSATSLALKQLFDGNQNIVVPAMWRAISKHCGDSMLDAICEDVANEVADQFVHRISASNPRERLKEFYSMISGTERLTQIDESANSLSIVKLSCPFITMHDDTLMICRIDQLAMQKIAGTTLQLTTSRHDGINSCCTFLFEDKKKKKGSSLE